MKKPFLSYKDYMQDVYGEPLFRIPLDLGLGCPNRLEDGTGGCAFCPEDGARAQQTINAASLAQQVEDATRFAKRRYGAKSFMAYIQAFTGTFASASEQRRIYSEALSLFKHKAIAIGTRPDCLSDETLDFLMELNSNEEVWVELGVQTANDATLKLINRGHSWHDSRNAILKLSSLGIKIVAHVILGFPGETADDFNSTAEELAALPIDGVKLHNLHIIKGAKLGNMFDEEPFKVYNEFEYAEAAMEFIRRMPENIPIMRVCTDTDEEKLIAPKWGMNKSIFLNYLTQQMVMLGYYQGELCGKTDCVGTFQDDVSQKILKTDDGSLTFWSEDFKEHYHSKNGALLETMGKFINPSNISQLLQQRDVRLLDICFGLGYNSLATMNVAEQLKKHKLRITALEIDKRVVFNSSKNMADVFEFLAERNILKSIVDSSQYSSEFTSVDMLLGDARYSAQKLDGSYDVIFLDAFSSQRNADLWTVDFFKVLAGLISPQGVLLTYSTALPIWAGLIEAGFHVGESAGGEKLRGGTIASLSENMIDEPVPYEKLAIIKNTTKGISYKDPYLSAPSREILKNREKAMKNFEL
ncbi:MAG: TIGR01212 family radical SAM protein [Kiritimatiellae bacterium]|jgi:radical SAM protein (TIGR01212 family)|nr:TIGR01212 family radical SAM protein [Kiritimatiellia bacterium]